MERIRNLTQLDEAARQERNVLFYGADGNPLATVPAESALNIEGKHLLAIFRRGMYIKEREHPQPRCAECGQWMSPERESEYCGRCEVYIEEKRNRQYLSLSCENCGVKVTVSAEALSDWPIYCRDCWNVGPLRRLLRRWFNVNKEQ